jgi:hypothetical protein
MYEVAALGRCQFGEEIGRVPVIGVLMLRKLGKKYGRSEG